MDHLKKNYSRAPWFGLVNNITFTPATGFSTVTTSVPPADVDALNQICEAVLSADAPQLVAVLVKDKAGSPTSHCMK